MRIILETMNQEVSVDPSFIKAVTRNYESCSRVSTIHLANNTWIVDVIGWPAELEEKIKKLSEEAS